MGLGDRDLPYRFKGLLGDALSHELRLAVFYPILRIKGRVCDWGLLFRRLLAVWRKQVGRLYALGCSTFGSVGRIRNCIPATLLLDRFYEEVRTCKMSNICPWCWCREHRILVELARSVRQDNDTLIVTRGTYRLPCSEHDSDSLHDQLQRQAQRASSLLRGLGRALSGGYWTVNVEPSGSKDKGRFWKVTVRTLLLVRYGRRVCLIPPDWQSVVKAHASDTELLRGFHSVLRYPAGLLRGPAALVQTALWARRGMRLSGAVGSFRGKSKFGKGD